MDKISKKPAEAVLKYATCQSYMTWSEVGSDGKKHVEGKGEARKIMRGDWEGNQVAS